ncbi:sigma-70 family RNA polymerase sigma factor [Lacticaseibacillus parakribbianus]|uniref:sigma-70 family RNA polymerase sigma factor n=1 Tax=Lacticaseibacillus parakribbianus TaxID=2970927 RepID=UPI0021CB2120|nr:sigma-70 family RNA polymerase sigma factor [Lacticaseibacillus parakribbianus]
MNEAELAQIHRAQDDSEDFETLFNQYRPLVYGQLKRYNLRDFDRDDWLQEARIAMYKAVQHFNGRRGSQFGPYYQLVLHSHFNSLLRRQLALKRQSDAQAIPVWEVGERRVDQRQDAAAVEADYLMYLEAYRFWNSLSPRELAALAASVVAEPESLEVIEATARHDRRAMERVHKKLVQHLQDLHRE